MKTLLTLITLLISTQLMADGLDDLSNYRQYSPTFASSGQPTPDHLALLANQGVERIIYLAYTDNETAIEAEDRKVHDLGMEYVHIPVDFTKPTLNDFRHFAAAMQSAPEKNTLVHCQINLRASAFSFLYRSIFQDVPVETALEDMYSVWAPNDDWYNFINSVAAHHRLDIFCEDCDWRGREIESTGRQHD